MHEERLVATLRRKKSGIRVEVKRMDVEIKASNLERVRAIAQARKLSIVECIDEMIEADWARRERMARSVPRENHIS